MTSDADPELVGPVVVGGIGGSGTTLVAEILREVGLYIGADLYGTNDNRWFDFLVSRPRWELRPPDAFDQPIYQALRVFDLAMTGRLKPTRADRKVIREARSRGKVPTERFGTRPTEWFRKRVDKLGRSRDSFPAGTTRWGWKIPGSYFFLPYLQGFYGTRLQYVHVIRHGVYMARSKNQNQLRSWGPLLGIDREHAASDASASLDFWITANQLAITQAQDMPASRFYVLNYDDLCSRPEQGIRHLLDFMQIDPPESTVAKLAGMPQPRNNQFSAEQLRAFTSTQLASVRAFGFDIEEIT
jgi:hypothetical protein